jgi:aspartyl-tRNA(Asn)/glutamyl-tRNA(Gln) amidotransferase subunit C
MAEPLSPETVARIAALARLELSEEETALFATQLADILALADQVRAVDTTGIDEFAHARNAAPPRPDEPAPPLDRAAVMAQAPEADPTTGLFKVPRVLGA